jgi:hypothetical protein
MGFSWAELFPEGALPEKRLRERAIKIGLASTERPGAAMTGAFDHWEDTRAAYDFFENERMSLDVLLEPPMRVVGQTLRGLPEGSTVLGVQDTTEINLSHLNTMSGLGEIGNPKNQGLFLHPSLAVTTDGVPIGLLSTQIWTRPPSKHGKAKRRRAATFEDKESLRWWTAIEHAEERVDRRGLLVHTSDRESDIYELFTRAKAASYRLLVRASRDRRVEGEHGTLWAQVGSFPSSKKHRTVSVPERPAKDGKPARAARETTVAIRYGAVALRAPHGASGSVEMWAIEVSEVAPPKGVEPIDWLLLTLDPITSFAEAWLRVEWYRCRWRIEEFFKVLKSGCRIEARQFESLGTFEVSLGISMLTAVHLLGLVKRARIEPDAPANVVLSSDEEHVLIQHANTMRNREASPSLRLAEAVVLIAMLGGYKARACDGPPGWITLWRGYRRLSNLVEGYRLARPTSRRTLPKVKPR